MAMAEKAERLGMRSAANVKPATASLWSECETSPTNYRVTQFEALPERLPKPESFSLRK